MPANAEYDRVPLLDHSPDLTDKGKYWEEIDKKDHNENILHNKRMEHFNDSLNLNNNNNKLLEDKDSYFSSGYSSSLSPTSSSEIISVPLPLPYSNWENKFPKERRKAVTAFLFMVFGFVCNSVSIVLTHQKIPDRTLHPPLPDFGLDHLTKQRWLNDVADVIVILCIISSVCLVILHRHRWILCRRVFIIMSILYCMRSVTMYVTVLPLANDHVYCSPKINTSLTFGQTVLIVTTEVIKLIGAGGLPITGKKTMCGDYIFSGHTIIYLMAYCLIVEYAPKKFGFLRWTSWGAAWIGMACLLISHGHYTIDVIIGYYATTRMFWMYHTFANHTDLQRRTAANSLSSVWWFPIFRYFEGSLKHPVPKVFSIPRLKIGRTITQVDRHK